MSLERWLEYEPSPDATHHLFRGRPAYDVRFDQVQKFHEPGIAPVRDASGAYHITPDGLGLYESRYSGTFGFYEGRAAVHSEEGWFHILPNGNPLYKGCFEWCGNFQENRCTVRLLSGDYYHIAGDGSPAYEQRYRYAGDFKDGHAVVQHEDGGHTHIGTSGKLLHDRWFQDLDVFHKRYARARDTNGWHHVDMSGESLYSERFKNVEPFYNGQARVERLDGSLSVIDESGQPLLELKGPSQTNLELLSGDMVGVWRTQTIHAAVELGAIECLSASAEEVERQTQIHESLGLRLMRALMELGLVWRDTEGTYFPTERGSLLTKDHPLSLVEAARHWGRESYEAWSGITRSLLTGESEFKRSHGASFFDWIQGKPADLQSYHSAISSYARHDYRDLADAVDFSVHDSILDAGGGTGELAFALLRSCPKLEATIMDRREVVERASPPVDLEERCRFIEGDIFQKWPVTSGAVVLARVIHDWPERDALRILRRAREAMPKDGTLYLVEMVLDEENGRGGLLDLNMLVMTQGAERTENQYRQLLEKAGLRMQRVIPVGSVVSVIVASPW